MKIDHAEFIARHHKGAGSASQQTKNRNRYAGFLAVMVLCLNIGIFLFIMTITRLDELTLKMMIMSALLLVLVVFVIYRSYSIHSMQEKELGLLKEVLEGSRGARIITDSADNTIFTNDKFRNLCGDMGPPEYQTLIKLFQNSEEAFAHFRLLADQAHRGLSDSIELFSNDERRAGWYTVSAQPVAGHAGFIHWRVEDVTEKHTVDRAIREEREKLIDFTDNAPVGFFSLDENGRFLFANATFARWVGDDLQVLLKQSVLHTYLLEPPKNAAPYDLIEKGGRRQVVEIRMKGPGGKSFLAAINQVVVKEEGGRVRTRAVVNDMTSEREMHKALKASEDRFQRFFEEAPLGIILIDQKGVIKDCNSEFASMLGADIGEVEGQGFKTFVKEEDVGDLVSAVDQIKQGQQMEAPLEITLQGRGKEVIAQMHGRRFKESDSTVLHFIDLTAQKSLEAQFVQSQKMQGIGQLAGGIAHDFNNLLTAIIGFSDLLLLRHKPGDPSFADIMQVKQNSNRAANLVRQLLAFSRQQTLRPRVQDITDILTELSHLLRRLIGANIDLSLVHGQDLGLVKVDEGQMEQVFINLAVNARDAMDGGGKLIIATENFTNKKPKDLGPEEMPVGHWILIKVTDTGTGMTKDVMDRIFEPFFTTKEVGHGTGLGLATVYGIIRQTGGYLHVESKPGHGAVFSIYLPRSNEAEEEAEEEFVQEERPQDLTGTERILLVEDEDAVRTFSQRAMTNKGYEVLAADCGEAALALLEKEKDKPIDLLITDVVMPNMDGPTLAQRIRQNNPALKIIFISGYTEDRLKDHMGENIYFLPKPFTLKQLAAKVKEVLEE